MQQDDSEKQNDIKIKKDLAKRILLGAIGCDILAVVYFLVITYAENQNGPTEVNALLAVVYDSMGKIGGTVLFFGLGMVFVIVYVIKMAGIKKMEQGSTPS